MKFLKEIRTQPFFRSPTVGKRNIDEENRTVTFTFSSEESVDRWFGKEILDHKKTSIMLDRFKAGANLLLDHDSSKVIGVIEKTTIDTDARKAAVTVRFSQSPLADEVFKDVVDGIRRNVSVGYVIHEMVQEKASKDGPDVFRATKWEPFEVSFVGVPADYKVGVGRVKDDHEIETRVYKDEKERRNEDMKKCLFCGREHAEDQLNERGFCPDCEKTRAEMAAAGGRTQPAAPAPQVAQVTPVDEVANTRKTELERIENIRKIGEEHDQEDLARKHINDGGTVADMIAATLVAVGAARVVETPELGMTKKDLSKYSVLRAIASQIPGLGIEAGFEREVSADVAKNLRKEPKGIFVPYDVQREQRDLNVTTATAGGNLVATDLLSMIELLRNNTMVRQLGATTLDGLVGDIAIPKQSGGATAYWLANEGDDVTESQQTIAQLSLSPKTVGALTEYTRQFMIQSSVDAENFVRTDLALILAIAQDLAAINGSGSSGQPTGILNTAGIGAVALATDGAAMTWPKFVEIWKEVAKDNAAFGNLGFLTNSSVHGHLMTVEKAGNTAKFIAEMFPGPDSMTAYHGARGAVSEQVPSNLTKGEGSSLSAMIYGNWRDLIIASWGGLDILVDPYTKSASGGIRIVALQSTDINVRHAESFSAVQDIDTTV